MISILFSVLIVVAAGAILVLLFAWIDLERQAHRNRKALERRASSLEMQTRKLNSRELF